MHTRGGTINQEPSTCVWLGNIHPDTTELELRDHLARYGMIESIKIIPIKGCAFVRFIELESAMQAYAGMLRSIVHGQQVKVGWGKVDPANPSSSSGGSRMKEDANSPPPTRNLWIGNIVNVPESKLREVFGQFGVIEQVRMVPHKNCAFVNFSCLEEAIEARKQLQGLELLGNRVKINFGKESPGSSSSSGRISSSSASMSGGEGSSNPLGSSLNISSNSSLPSVEPPPPYQAPPNDAITVSLIDKTADFVCRNGVEFERITLQKQKDNPKFAFLHDDHPDHGYYKWKLWTLRNPGLDPFQFEQQLQQEQEKQRQEKQESRVYGAVPPPSSTFSGTNPNLSPSLPPGTAAILAQLNQLSGVPQTQQSGYQISPNEINRSYYQSATSPIGTSIAQTNSLSIPSQYLPSSNSGNNIGNNLDTHSGSGNNNNNNNNNNNKTNTGSSDPSLRNAEEGSFNAELRTQLGNLLDNLVPTKDSIRVTKTWIMQRPNMANEIASFIGEKIRDAKDLDSKIHAVYLIHDILHHSSNKRKDNEQSDVFSEAFESHLAAILASAYGGQSEENQEKIIKVMKIWEEKNIFPENIIKVFFNAVQSSDSVFGKRSRGEGHSGEHHHESKRRHY